MIADVTPVHPDCHQFVITQRRDVFDDLRQALRIMKIINDQTPIPNMLYAMWLLENKQLRQGANINVSAVIQSTIDRITGILLLFSIQYAHNGIFFLCRIVAILLSSPKLYNKRFSWKSISIG